MLCCRSVVIALCFGKTSCEELDCLPASSTDDIYLQTQYSPANHNILFDNLEFSSLQSTRNSSIIIRCILSTNTFHWSKAWGAFQPEGAATRSACLAGYRDTKWWNLVFHEKILYLRNCKTKTRTGKHSFPKQHSI